MVHQASTLSSRAPRRQRPGRARVAGPDTVPAPEAAGPGRLTERRPVADGSWSRIAGLTPPRMLAVFLVALILPFSFNIASLQLNAYNSVLIVCIIPAFFYFIRLPGVRIVGLDVFMALHVLWLGVAIYHAYGSARIVFIINQSLVLFGAYFMGRVLVRSAEDHERLFRYMLRILLVLFPFAFIEFAAHFSLIDRLMGRGGGGGGAGGMRLGFRRVATVFPHPILFGVFCSIFVANFFYVFYRSTWGRLRTMGFAMVMTFMALSSGPLIAMLLQLMMIGWERLLRLFPPKWFLLMLFGSAVLAMLQLAYPGGLLAFVIDTFAYNEQTGYGRTEILEYGSASVLRNPLFGIGLSADWGQPWWRPPSVDNYWLVVSMRYGLPALAFMWIGFALHATQIAARRNLSEEAVSYRKGYLIALAGIFVALGTVHIWGAVSVFIMFYLGAGVWFYSTPAATPVSEPVSGSGSGSGSGPATRRIRGRPADGTPSPASPPAPVSAGITGRPAARPRRSNRTKVGLSA